MDDKANETEPCTHGVVYDPTDIAALEEGRVRQKYPRLSGLCPLGCGYTGIYYVSFEHYIAGDW